MQRVSAPRVGRAAPGLRVAGQLHRARQPGDRDRSALAVTRLEIDAACGRAGTPALSIGPALAASIWRVERSRVRRRSRPSDGAFGRRATAPRSASGGRRRGRLRSGVPPSGSSSVWTPARLQDRRSREAAPVCSSGAAAVAGRAGIPAPAIAPRVGDERHGAERDESAPVEMDARHECQQRPRCADDRERAEERRPSPRTRSAPARSAARRAGRSRRA